MSCIALRIYIESVHNFAHKISLSARYNLWIEGNEN